MKVIKIYPIINISLFKPGNSTFRKKYKIKDSEIILLNVSGPGKRKNFNFLLRAISKLPRNYRLIHIGKLGEESELLMHQLKITDRLINFNRVSSLALSDIYRASDIYVHPSFFEGFGMPIAEAMASGCFVMGANCASIPEVIGDTGTLFDPYDLDYFVEILLNYGRNEEFYMNKREQGRARSLRFSIDSIMPRLIDVYRKI